MRLRVIRSSHCATYVKGSRRGRGPVTLWHFMYTPYLYYSDTSQNISMVSGPVYFHPGLTCLIASLLDHYKRCCMACDSCGQHCGSWQYRFVCTSSHDREWQHSPKIIYMYRVHQVHPKWTQKWKWKQVFTQITQISPKKSICNTITHSIGLTLSFPLSCRCNLLMVNCSLAQQRKHIRECFGDTLKLFIKGIDTWERSY